MGKIHVLDKHVAELIAAGEVVERPASVIKELVENAADAGATLVTVEIQRGGISMLRVADNGSGIARDDVQRAFLRHATSKIQRQNDLDSIGTLGFRGEALASIAAVARVELLTRTEEELSGTHYVIEGGEEVSLEDAGCPQGTTVIVRNLFFNTPARMKFLKKDMVEANAVAGILDKIALSRPEISFRLIRDGRETLYTPGSGQLEQAIYAVYGKDFTAGLVPVEYTYNYIRVWGMISRPAACRPNRSMQHFFINGRYVKSRTAMVALEEAYKGSVMVGKFPACVLHFSIALEAVDVNVHPAKIEVRFINERPIFDVVYHGVKTALNRGDVIKGLKIPIPTPTVPSEPAVLMRQTRLPEALPVEKIKFIGLEIPKDTGFEEAGVAKKPFSSVQEVIFPAPPAPGQMPFVQASSPEKTQESPFAAFVEAVLPEEEAAAVAPEESRPLQVRGEVFDTYIIAEYGADQMLLIDKHAAHERLLYEKLKETAGEAAQQLLTPVTVTLQKEEYAALLEQVPLLAAAGFEVEDFGAGAVLLRSVPLYLDVEGAKAAIAEIAGYLSEQRADITTEHLDWLYHNIACRAAVKAGNSSSLEEIVALARRLEENPDVRYCPHGRPVSLVMKKRDIDRQFGRV